MGILTDDMKRLVEGYRFKGPAMVHEPGSAARLGMADEGMTGRWYGLTTRQFRKSLPAGDR